MSDLTKISETMRREQERRLWQSSLETDREMRTAIEKGWPFARLKAESNCPESLRGRYEQLQQMADAEERRTREDRIFLDALTGKDHELLQLLDR